jgi:hypothetical protein
MHRFRILLSPDPEPTGGPEPADKTVTKGKKKPSDIPLEQQIADLREEMEANKAEQKGALGRLEGLLSSGPGKKTKAAPEPEPDVFDRFINWLRA